MVKILLKLILFLLRTITIINLIILIPILIPLSFLIKLDKVIVKKLITNRQEYISKEK